jgi:hypothetical protein
MTRNFLALDIERRQDAKLHVLGQVGGSTMPYVLYEVPENGEKVILGEPVHDLIVAKVIASRRAMRTQRVTTVSDQTTGEEVAYYEPTDTPKTSMKRLRAARPEEDADAPDLTYSRKKSG